jgi:hypothetical protein
VLVAAALHGLWPQHHGTHTHKKSMQAWHTSITHVLKHEHSQWNCHDRPCPSALKFAEACGCHGPATARNQTATYSC